MLVLGIESSCDETAAAVIEAGSDGVRVRSDVVHSQIDLHKAYGGVVPELASRDHLARLLPVIEASLDEAGATLAQVDIFTATAGPGLIGALLVGVQGTKALAWATGKPFSGANHLAGHALAVRLGACVPAFPYLALVASGGHTSIYDVRSGVDIVPLGHTLDDAAGEAFDKVGKMLGLDYPAGARIDRLARDGDKSAWDFPRALKMKTNFDFSFSGLKTSVLTHVAKHGRPSGQALADVCASFQEAVCDSLVTKALRAAEATGRDRVVIGGGVAANSRLRTLLQERGRKAGREVYVPAPALCTDNGAMIALAGWHAFSARGADPLSLNADAAWRP